ncbi:MAG: IS1634 family transposase [Acidobacteriota bacterium]
MFIRRKRSGKYNYLQIVENRREDGTVRQRVIGTLGREDELRDGGQIEGLLASGARFTENMLVLAAHEEGRLVELSKRHVGGPKIFGKLWEETGCADVVRAHAAERRFGFDAERAIFTTVLHRLFDPGSDRACEVWKESCAIAGAEALQLQHFYRAMGWLGEAIPEAERGVEAPFSRRFTKNLIEEDLFHRRRSLFTNLDMMFFDTTSLYFEGEGGETLGQYGHSKDHRPDLKQMVVGAVLDGEGNPVSAEMWPGNTADVTTLVPLSMRLKRRFGVSASCLVADRGMISGETLAWLEAPETRRPFILGARMRAQKEVGEEVLSRAGRYHVIHGERRTSKDPSPLKVKEVFAGDRRYIVCHNEDQARKDARDRETILAGLEEQLKKGDKALVGNKGYRKYLRAAGSRFEIDRAKAEAEARFDGKWVLRTNTDLPAAEVALKYKQLWTVEDLFRSVKSVLSTRPIYHKCDETILGHVFCSFLALILVKALEDRLQDRDLDLEWARVIRDLDQMEEVELEQDGKRFILRVGETGCCGKVFQAAGVAVPTRLRRA